MRKGTANFLTREDAARSLLARHLFEIDGVTAVFNLAVAAHGGHISLIDVRGPRVSLRLEGGSVAWPTRRQAR